MKTGLSLVELAGEIERQAGVKRDYIVPTSQLEVTPAAQLVASAGAPMPMTSHAHGQLATLTGVPKSYYDRMLEDDRALLASNVNRWLADPELPTHRMVRTLDGRARGLMSRKYRRIDYAPMAEAVFPAIGQHGLVVKSAQVTDTRLYIKAVSPRLELPVTGSRRVGDVVAAGVMVSNSEVGAGAVSVRRFIECLVCTNGMVGTKEAGSFTQVHLGRAELIEGELSQETDDAINRALWLQVRDVIGAALDPERFAEAVAQMSVAAGQRIVSNDPAKVIDAAVRALELPQGAAGPVLRHLIEGGDLSRWGLVNAVTRYAADVESYDDATATEEAGSKLLEMPAGSWEVIAKAA